MALRFCSLGSGSEGNALIVESRSSARTTRVMLDCGFGLAATTTRLGRAGLVPSDIDAVVVTHEHSDHIGGVARFSRRHNIPVWLTHGTAKVLRADSIPPALLHFVDPHASFVIGDIEVTPFTVPHDAYEPVQYTFGDGRQRLGVLTDVGSITPHIESSLTGCDALVIEANHDARMLDEGPYPASLKRRVSGRFGHLDNETAAAMLTRIDCSALQHLVAAHLSRQNNTASLARGAFARALGCGEDWIAIASQDEGLDWRSLAG